MESLGGALDNLAELGLVTFASAWTRRVVQKADRVRLVPALRQQNLVLDEIDVQAILAASAASPGFWDVSAYIKGSIHLPTCN
jgi:hypothetical protein